jgi:transcription antitermination factor NusG
MALRGPPDSRSGAGGELPDQPAPLTVVAAVQPADGRRWYACHTRARSEKRVAALLLERDVAAFLPTVALVRKWADRRRIVAFPLFPGYVFARFELTHLHSVLSVPGLATVVRLGGRPAPIRDAEIENLRRVAAALSLTGTRPEPQPFQRGNVVRVADGPFRGVRGVVIELRGRRRLLVGLRAVGLAISIDVDVVMLERH